MSAHLVHEYDGIAPFPAEARGDRFSKISTAKKSSELKTSLISSFLEIIRAEFMERIMANRHKQHLRRRSVFLVFATITPALAWWSWNFTNRTSESHSQRTSPSQLGVLRKSAKIAATTTPSRSIATRHDHEPPQPLEARRGTAAIHCRIYRRDQIPAEQLEHENQLLRPESAHALSEQLRSVYPSFEPIISLRPGENDLIMDVGTPQPSSNHAHISLHFVFLGEQVQCDRLFVGLQPLAHDVDKGPIAPAISLRTGCGVLTPLPPTAHIGGYNDAQVFTVADSSDRASPTAPTINCLECHPREEITNILGKIPANPEWLVLITADVLTPAAGRVEALEDEDPGF